MTDWKHEAAERIREAGWVDVPEEKITAELEAAYRRGQSEPHVPRYSLDEIDRMRAAVMQISHREIPYGFADRHAYVEGMVRSYIAGGVPMADVEAKAQAYKDAEKAEQKARREAVDAWWAKRSDTPCPTKFYYDESLWMHLRHGGMEDEESKP